MDHDCVVEPVSQPDALVRSRAQLLRRETRTHSPTRQRHGGEWCNGSTADSGSACLGSNPSSPAYANLVATRSCDEIFRFLGAIPLISPHVPISPSRSST